MPEEALALLEDLRTAVDGASEERLWRVLLGASAQGRDGPAGLLFVARTRTVRQRVGLQTASILLHRGHADAAR